MTHLYLNFFIFVGVVQLILWATRGSIVMYETVWKTEIGTYIVFGFTLANYMFLTFTFNVNSIIFWCYTWKSYVTHM